MHFPFLLAALLFLGVPIVVPWLWPRWIIAIGITVGFVAIAATIPGMSDDGVANAISFGSISFIVVLLRKYLLLKGVTRTSDDRASQRVLEARVAAAATMRDACLRAARMAGADELVSLHINAIDPEVVN